MLILASALPLTAADKWVRVQTPNFIVLSNGSEHQARECGKQFEQIRGVFEKMFAGYRLEAAAPTVVIAARDEDTLKSLLPEFWVKRGGARPAGVFRASWESSYAVVRLDVGSSENEIVYHEYVHQLLHLNFLHLPPWLDEGLAEFLGNVVFSSKEAKVGAPSPRISLIRTGALLPLDKLIPAGRSSPYYRDADKVQLFYAESWILVHFLTFGPSMESGKKLNAFFRQVQNGAEQMGAFRSTFGDPKAIESQLYPYARQALFNVWIVPDPPHANEKSFPVHSLSLAEYHAAMAEWKLRENVKDAQTEAEAALRLDPNVAAAHRVMGFIAFHRADDRAAAAQFEQALKLDSTDYLSAYYHAMLTDGAATDPGLQENLLRDLTHVVKLNDRFAPAHVELARLHVRQRDLQSAVNEAARALQLEPGRAGYRLLAARILILVGQPAEAGVAARLVAERWHGGDRDEALEVLQEATVAQMPAAKSDAKKLEAGGTPPTDSSQIRPDRPEGTFVEGILKSVRCTSSREESLLSLETSGQLLVLWFGERFQTWLDDTLWYGGDHFNLCRHVENRRVQVVYKAQEGKAPRIEQIRICDDLPVPVTQPAPSKPASSRN